jgi:hypothetical protein
MSTRAAATIVAPLAAGHCNALWPMQPMTEVAKRISAVGLFGNDDATAKCGPPSKAEAPAGGVLQDQKRLLRVRLAAWETMTGTRQARMPARCPPAPCSPTGPAHRLGAEGPV